MMLIEVKAEAHSSDVRALEACVAVLDGYMDYARGLSPEVCDAIHGPNVAPVSVLIVEGRGLIDGPSILAKETREWFRKFAEVICRCWG
jgi:hypothetical protein